MKKKIKEIIDNLLIALYPFKLYPKILNDKIKLLKQLRKIEKLFSSNQFNLEKKKLGIYRPKTTINDKLWQEYLELTTYKKWHQNTLLRHRDILHFETIKKIYPDIQKKKLKILNYGAGHGGISILFNIMGHEVVNYDPVKMHKIMNENWHCVTSLKQLNTIFDFIYNSHSFAAVNNLNEDLKELTRITDQNTNFFIEESIKTKFNKPTIKFKPPRINYFENEFFFKNIFEKVDQIFYFKNKDLTNGLIDRTQVTNYQDADLIQIFTRSKLKSKI